MSDPGPAPFPAQRAGIHVRRDDAGPMLFDEGGRQVCLLNETALALWELCDGETAPEEMVDAVRIACGLPREVAETDIARTLRELTDAGLLWWGAGDG
jgi:hypothetical protein